MSHDTITTSRPGLHLAPPVRWEPCAEHDDDPTDPGVCGSCGWSADDHDLASRVTPIRSAHQAPLRRAS
jgi:hypothetical protein